MVEEAKEKLSTILNDWEYQVYYEQSTERWFERIVHQIQEWLRKLLSNLFPAFEPTQNIAYIIFIFALLGLMILLIFFFIRFIGNIFSHRKLKQHRPIQFEHELEWTYEQHLLEVEKWEKKESYSQATRHLFLAILLYFHEKKLLVAKIWKTNWEYFDELRRANKNIAEFFYEIVQLFDVVTYGEKEVSREEYIHCRYAVMDYLENERTNKAVER